MVSVLIIKLWPLEGNIYSSWWIVESWIQALFLLIHSIILIFISDLSFFNSQSWYFLAADNNTCQLKLFYNNKAYWLPYWLNDSLSYLTWCPGNADFVTIYISYSIRAKLLINYVRVSNFINSLMYCGNVAIIATIESWVLV